MVQLDIPTAFAVSQLFAYLGRKKIKKEAAESGDKKPPIYYRYLFYSVFFSSVCIWCVGGPVGNRYTGAKDSKSSSTPDG